MNRNRLFITQLIVLFFTSTTFIVEPVFANPTSANVGKISGSLQIGEWIIDSTDSSWTVQELEFVREVLTNTVNALDDAGYDGQQMLGGYRFRRQQGEFVDGIDGRIALVRHHKREVILADTAFLRLQGFYIYHELGHVVDKRLERRLTEQFHKASGTAPGNDSHKTVDGYWLNEHARADRQEATADAFALLVVLNYTDNYKPVFWHTPITTDYEQIVNTMAGAMQQAK